MGTQTLQEQTAIADYWFEKLAPVGFLNTEHNASEIARFLQKENLPFSFDNLTRAVTALGNMEDGGKLQFNPKPRVVVVYKEPEKTAEDVAREKRTKFERAHSLGLLQSPKHHRTELDRGEENKTILTEEQKAAINARNKRTDTIIADVWHKIQTFTGHSHARTFAGRDELKKVFQNGMDRGLPADQIEKLVDAKLEKLAR